MLTHSLLCVRIINYQLIFQTYFNYPYIIMKIYVVVVTELNSIVLMMYLAAENLLVGLVDPVEVCSKSKRW